MARPPRKSWFDVSDDDEDVEPTVYEDDPEESTSRTLMQDLFSASPVLPFFGVLLRGKDAPLLGSNKDRHGVPIKYHPSVGYARDIYVAISMNWLVDVLGFTWMFHGYFVSFEPWWLPWIVAVVLGITFSSAFATFAISMVRKPIKSARISFLPALVSVVLLLGAVGGFAYSIWGPPEVLEYEGLLRLTSLVMLLASAATFLFTTFGFSDGSMVFTRAGVMFAVGYLVAGPLHETMFYREILEEYRKQETAEVTTLAVTKQEERDAARRGAFETCMRRLSFPPDPECLEAKQRHGAAALLVDAIEFVKDEELRGKDPVATRGYLLDKAKEYDATAVMALIGAGSTGKRGKGPRYYQALGMEKESKQDLAEAKAHEDRCLEAVATCEAEAAAAPAVAALSKEIEELEVRAEEVADGTEQPGVIDRAMALEAITAGEGTGEDAEARSVWMASRLAAAWFLAMVMPLIVLVMKITAGDKLEKYLRARWKGLAPK